MIKDVFVVDASAHSYDLREDNYATGRYSQAAVDAFYGAHYSLSPVGHRLPREQRADKCGSPVLRLRDGSLLGGNQQAKSPAIPDRA
jgi:hypothetical protein